MRRARYIRLITLEAVFCYEGPVANRRYGSLPARGRIPFCQGPQRIVTCPPAQRIVMRPRGSIIRVMKAMPKVRCPTCKKRGDWFGGAYGPFCSKRCKLVDLGKWLNEENKVAGGAGGAAAPPYPGGRDEFVSEPL